jgi:hypothetical protein
MKLLLQPVYAQNITDYPAVRNALSNAVHWTTGFDLININVAFSENNVLCGVEFLNTASSNGISYNRKKVKKVVTTSGSLFSTITFSVVSSLTGNKYTHRCILRNIK